jgi:hypothetical protein
MSDPRWRDSDPRPLYRDEQGPATRRQPVPRERGRDWRPGGPEPGSWAYGHDDRPARGARPPARVNAWLADGPPDDAQPHGGPLRWGAMPGVLGVCIVIGGAAVGALVSAVTSSQPGFVLSAFLIAGTVGAVLAVQPRSVHAVIPVPALAYLVASVLTGLAVNQNGTTLTALAVGAAQWVASGFVAMIASTVIAVAATIVRRPRNQRAPRRTLPPAQASRSRRPTGDRSRRLAGDWPRRAQDARPRRAPDRRADSVATAATPEWYRERRNG